MAPEFVMAAPPDLKTTVGFALIFSLAVMLRVTSLLVVAQLFDVPLLDAMPTLSSVGAVLSNVTPWPVKLLEFEELSVTVTL